MVEPWGGEVFGDEWEETGVSDDKADRIARCKGHDSNELQIRLKDADQFKVEQSVFDDVTFTVIYKLAQGGHIDALGGPISTGKEANVFETFNGDGANAAIETYRINAPDFRHIRDYLEGDPRFENIGHGKGQVIHAWARKKFANPERAQCAGVCVPKLIAAQRNVLVMELIGVVDDRARRLLEVRVESPQTACEVVREYMHWLHCASLVHDDLSEYNLIIHDDELVVVDLGRAIMVHHPNAEEFFRRGCRGVVNLFRRRGTDASGDLLYGFVMSDEGGDGDGDE